MTDLKPCPKQYSLSELQAHPYQTAMQMVHERALEIAAWNTRATTKLPEGYLTEDYQLFHGHALIADKSFGFLAVDPEDEGLLNECHWPALAAFLQGAR